MNKAMKEKIESVAEEAQLAFWAVVADNFPECKSGDLDPMFSSLFSISCTDVVEEWVKTNSEVLEKARALNEAIADAYANISKASMEFIDAKESYMDYAETSGMVTHTLMSLNAISKGIEKDILYEED